MAGYKFSMDTVAPPVEGAVKLVELASIDGNSVGVFPPNDIIQIERRKFFFPNYTFIFFATLLFIHLNY